MLHFVKGHGTENDFVVLPDPDGRLELTPALVRALCDRRGGLGADGVLRVVPVALLRDAGRYPGADWFMDYRNADGSIAEMCGNGIRLYARYLVDSGLARPGTLTLATRDGTKTVRLAETGDVTVDMGTARALGTATAVIGGVACAGTHIDMGNPHLVCAVEGDLAGWDFSRPPEFDASVFPDGVNIEVVALRGPRHVDMRVYERGVGETRSCGTGACAVAVAMQLQDLPAATDADSPADTRWTVDVPGGRLTVDVVAGSVQLTGPAVIVAAGEVDEDWLAAATALYEREQD